MLRALGRVADALVFVAALIGAAALVSVMGVILVNVTGRAFGRPLYGTQDIVQMSALIAVFGGMAFAERRGGHIAVDLLESTFPPAMNRALLAVGRLAGAAVFTIIGWRLWESSKLDVMMNRSTNLLELPFATFKYVVVALCALTTIVFLISALEGLAAERSDGA